MMMAMVGCDDDLGGDGDEDDGDDNDDDSFHVLSSLSANSILSIC